MPRNLLWIVRLMNDSCPPAERRTGPPAPAIAETGLVRALYCASLVLACVAAFVPAQGQEPVPEPEWEARVVAAASALPPQEQELVMEAFQRATSIPLGGIVNGECYALRFRDYIGEHGYPPDAPVNAMVEFNNSHAWATCVERDRLAAWARARAVHMFLRKLPVTSYQSYCISAILAAASAEPRRAPLGEQPCLDGIEADLQLTAEGLALLQELRQTPEAVLALYDPEGIHANTHSQAMGAEVLLELVGNSAHRDAAESYEAYLQCISNGYANEYLNRLDAGHAGVATGRTLRDIYSDVALECDRR